MGGCDDRVEAMNVDTITPLLDGYEEEYVNEICGVGFLKESKKLWRLAGPAIFTGICQYALGALTQAFAGSIGELELAAVSIENSVIAGLAYGVMLGMGSALETLCGQAFGAGNMKMMGIYMQRSWLILLATSILLVPIYVWSPLILQAMGQTTDISNAAGRFALWMIPQLFAYAVNFPIQKFLQAQGKIYVMAWISAAVMILHAFFSWLLILKLEWGLIGAAITLNTSWWLIVIGQLVYIFITKSDGAWSGFSWLAFTDLLEFVKLSLSSAIMLCLEFWYGVLLMVIAGRLPNPLVSVDAMSICVRVSNELGAGNAPAAKFSVAVVSVTSIAIGLISMIVVLATRDFFPTLFTGSEEVTRATTKLSILLAFSVLLNSLGPVLSGVAVGAGWQALVAYINLGSLYIVGLPAGILLGFTFGFGVVGIWSGMTGGAVLQTIILIAITSLTNWNKEADEAESRITKWGGPT
ncbi:hypothetical protein ACFE04_007390 [Oxalis oulophora]